MSVINSLDYVDIRASIVNFLKLDPYYKDFNFEAANISRLINMLAYSSMYNGYYMKMLLDESMPDSAKTKTALIGHANTRNYLTKFISASKAILSVTVDGEGINKSECPYIQISKGQGFKGIDKNGKQVYFVSLFDTTLLYSEKDDLYVGDDFTVIQGQEKTTSFEILEVNKKYQISDPQCDDTTIRIKVKTNKNASSFVEYIRKDDFYNVKENEKCFYITASTSGIYQIHFGRDIFGREPKPGEFIEISYIKTNGEEANDASKFELILNKKNDTLITDINFYSKSSIELKTIESSSGGLQEETSEELRYAIQNFSRQRSRVVTDEDIKAVIISDFRDVESVNVWSGANSERRRYGKTYISIKPKTTELLSRVAKESIANILINKYGIISKTDLIFVDPNFTDILLTVKYRLNRSITSDNTSTSKAKIEALTQQYNKNTLSKFDVNYYDSEYTSYIQKEYPPVSSVFTEKILLKTLRLNYSTGKFTVNYGNAIKNFKSDIFEYGNVTAYIKNIENGNTVGIFNATTDSMIAIIGNIDLMTGSITINIPTYVKIENLFLKAEAVYIDVLTLEDNIVRIKTINVIEI